MTLAKLETIAAAVSFAGIFGMGLLRQVAIYAGVPQETADVMMKLGILALFFIFAFCCMGLMIHVFIVLQIKAGNGAQPMIQFLARNETGVTVGFWCFLGLGLVIALPFALHDLVGLNMPIGRTKGVLVADIGMTIDEMKQRSTFAVEEPRHMADGSWLGVRDVVFDFQIGDSKVIFPQSRYYWISTPRDDRRIDNVNIGITPRKMPKSDLDAFQHKWQSELLADGWMPAHFLAESEQTVVLWGGNRTSGDGRYWGKGNTLLIFETSRMDEQKRDEPKDAGEYILNVLLRAKSHEPKLVYERSAWK